MPSDAFMSFPSAGVKSSAPSQGKGASGVADAAYSAAGSLPERDSMGSPNHRMRVANNQTAFSFQDKEVLATAKHLAGLDGFDTVDVPSITGPHVMIDHHEVILAGASWTGPFPPTTRRLRGVGRVQQTEVFELFPELATRDGRARHTSACQSPKQNEAYLITQ